jgi:hypothetical protein
LDDLNLGRPGTAKLCIDIIARKATVPATQFSVQSELNFGEDAGTEGYTRWLVGRQVATEMLARKIGLPLGHEVEVWLVGGVRLRGKLRLQEEALFIEEEPVRHLGLRVDNVAFTYREMESCVRRD